MAPKADFLFVTALFLLFVSCDRSAVVPFDADGRHQLVVAMDIDMPGYFAVGDENFGYQYDLLNAYAANLGMDLKIIPGKTSSECEALLAGDSADMVATLSDHVGNGSVSLPVYSTSYSILSGMRNAGGFSSGNSSMQELMQDRRIMISAGFKATTDCDRLLDELRFSQVFVSSRNCIELAEGLSDGQYDYLICEKSEAQISCALVSGIEQVYDFPGKISVNIVVNPDREGLSDNFSEWFAKYRCGQEYAMLNYLYFDKGMVGQLIAKGPWTSGGKGKGISAYDKLMREICEREGYDWRLMSAIAYYESRFNTDVVSARGARGLMQIMPSTARQFDVAPSDLEKPEVSIMLAAKLLGKIETALKLPKDISYEDRMSIVLACYNCGVGHVLDARRLAAKYGGNPDSWNDVSLFLERKSLPEYHQDEAVRCGRLRDGRQTLAFVSNVMGRYNSYCSAFGR